LGPERPAAVVAGASCVVYRLTQPALAQMLAADPEVATACHQLIVHLVSAVNAPQQVLGASRAVANL
jgi:CRP-like cAMP-binding protein